MNTMLRALALAGAMAFGLVTAHAQRFEPGQIHANATDSPNPARATDPSPWLDRWCGSTQGFVAYRGEDNWGCALPGATSGVQPYDASLTAFASLATAADKCLYFSAADTPVTFDCLSWARSVISAASASAGRDAFGLEIGADVQAYSARLADIAALSVTDGNIIVGNGSTWVAESGSSARSSLGLVIGADVQAYHSALGALSSNIADDQIFVGTGSNTGVWTSLPNCVDTGGQHLNYTASTQAFSCGTSGGGGGGGGGMPAGYLFGLEMSNNVSDATNDIDIAVGKARDDTDAEDIALTGALTKRLDAAWAVGTNQGGLDTGSISNTTYHVWLIKRSDTGVVDVLFSTSASSPTMPADYDFKRRIGSIVRSGGAILSFTQKGDEFLWKDNIVDVNGAATSTTAADITHTVPTGVEIGIILTLRVDYISAATTVLMTSKHQNDQAASSQNQTTVVSSGSTPNGANLILRSNTSAQTRIRSTSTGAQYIIVTTGWVDRRGRDS